MLSETIVVLDFETTGLRADFGDRITEIAALRLRGNQVIARYETLMNCDVRLSRHIKAFTGITQDMIDNGVAPWQAIPELLSFIGNDPVIAHNAAFDQGFLDCECERLHLQRSGADFLCTVQLARALYPQLNSYGLGSLASMFRLPYMPAHRAGADAQTTVNLLLHMSVALQKQYGLETVDTHLLRHLIQAHHATSSASSMPAQVNLFAA